MADFTSRMNLPYIQSSQAQKHVTHNEALAMLDLLTGIIPVLDRDLTAPPGAVDGAVYILGGSGTGSWAGYAAGNLALRIDGAWRRVVPSIDMIASIADEAGTLVFWSGAAWTNLVQGLTTFAKLGINAAADNTNRLAVKSNAALFSHDDVTPGTGDMRVTLNKSAAGKDAGFTFQDGFSTRALFGLLADDNFTIKVSPDGSVFKTALTINRTTGVASLAGTATNDNAGAGQVGEIIEATVAQGSAIALTTGVAVNVTSISLTAGDWDVSGTVVFTTAATTSVTRIIASISQSSATHDPVTGSAFSSLFMTAVVPGVSSAVQKAGPIRISLASTTNVYLVGSATFTASTLTAWGHLLARRAR